MSRTYASLNSMAFVLLWILRDLNSCRGPARDRYGNGGISALSHRRDICDLGRGRVLADRHADDVPVVEFPFLSGDTDSGAVALADDQPDFTDVAEWFGQTDPVREFSGLPTATPVLS
jgi:hypothetical protein